MLSTSDSDLQRFLRNLLLSAKNREDAIEKSQGLKKKILHEFSPSFDDVKFRFKKKKREKQMYFVFGIHAHKLVSSTKRMIW